MEKQFQSPFLEKRERLIENDIGFVIFDGFPVSEGHCLIVPHRVYSNYFDSTQEEIIGLQTLVVETKTLIDKRFNPDGYNVGINCGEISSDTSLSRGRLDDKRKRVISSLSIYLGCSDT